ncbi:DUF1700 domain-containing protein [uncultured Dialister sp.]|uniref:DUF1700 domain-containing protein n=1 Tax=uncultured Dialister sp. TaxID=278064 RepID=UPI0026323F4C|nr:DUF1700 domain-containing protein [uncultured Dialister sp.]
MTKNEFMKELRTYLIYEQASLRNEILTDYETYFAMGAANGLTEEETAAGLDSPSRIAASICKRDVSRKAGLLSPYFLQTAERGMKKVRSLSGFLLPVLRHGSASFIRWSGLFSAVLLTLAVALAIGLFAGGLTIFPSLPPLPVMNPLSLGLLALSGLSLSYFLYAAGRSLSHTILSVNPISIRSKGGMHHE